MDSIHALNACRQTDRHTHTHAHTHTFILTHAHKHTWKVMHRANVTAFDCVIDLLLKACDASAGHAHVSYRRHPYSSDSIPLGARHPAAAAAGTYPVVDIAVLRQKLTDIARALQDTQGRGGVPRHMECVVPRHAGWNKFHEALPDDEIFRGEDPLSLGLEYAGAPPFEHNMGLYYLDSLLLGDPAAASSGGGDGGGGWGFEGRQVPKIKSGVPAQRLGDFFFNMGGELTSVQVIDTPVTIIQRPLRDTSVTILWRHLMLTSSSAPTCKPER